MVSFLALFLFSVLAMAQSPVAGQTPEPLATTDRPVGLHALPPMPGGTSTVIGGEIRDVDPVRDAFTLKVFGGQSLKLLFDERTQVFRDGVRISVLDLHPEDHASVETTLDGTKIFARRIHMLSQLPQGECRGQVVRYDPQSGELTVRVASSQTSITLRVPPGTPVVRVGSEQAPLQGRDASELIRGSLVDVTFNGGAGGRGVATQIEIVAVPGSLATFSGSVSFLNAQAGRLVIVDQSNQQSHEIVFDASRFPISRSLHEGSNVKVTTSFDGSRYVANEIAIE